LKKTLLVMLVILMSILMASCIREEKAAKLIMEELSKEEPPQSSEVNYRVAINLLEPSYSILYENTEYGFNFSLPISWKGYKIVTEKWEGVTLGAPESGNIIETGPIISIRHPKWTTENPRQDIPIMIFTVAQWKAMQQEKFHIGAAPMGPRELDRNSSYVFALPARYNYAFLIGFEEVEQILNGNPLQILDKKNNASTILRHYFY
jgi:hypothetical protein